MEHRQDRVHGFPAVLEPRHPRPALRGVGLQIGVGEHGGLGQARGAGRVLQDGEVPGRRARMLSPEFSGFEEFAPRQHWPHGGSRPGAPLPFAHGEGGAGLAGGGDRQPQGQALQQRHRRDQLHRDNTAEPDVGRQLADPLHRLVPDDRDDGPVVFELVAQFPFRVEGIVFDDDGAQAQDGMEGDDVLRAVRQDQGDPVAGLHPEFLQAGGRPPDQGAQLAVARPGAEELQRGLRPVAANGRFHEVNERTLGEHEVRRHPWPVGTGPRPVAPRQLGLLRCVLLRCSLGGCPQGFLFHDQSLPLESAGCSRAKEPAGKSYRCRGGAVRC